MHYINTGEDFSTIQEAIDDTDTADGYIITVDPGTYTENVNINKQLTIRSTSQDYNDTFIEAADANDNAFEIHVHNVTIRGFSVSVANGGGKAGIRVSDNLNGCTIENNRVGWDAQHYNNYGILIHNSLATQDTIQNTTITGNVCGYNAYIIWLYRHCINNTINSNKCTYGDVGIYLDNTSDGNTVSENTCQNNSSAGIWAIASSNNGITDNDCSNNFAGISIYDFSLNNTLSDNIYNNNQGGGIAVTLGSDGNTVLRNTCNSYNSDQNVDAGILVSD